MKDLIGGNHLNYADIVVFALLVISIVHGWSKGLIKSIMGFLKWILGFLLTKQIYKPALAYFTANIWNPLPALSVQVQTFLYKALGMAESTNDSLSVIEMQNATSNLSIPEYYKANISEMLSNEISMTTQTYVLMVSDYIGQVIINVLGFLILFFISMGLVGLVAKVLGKISKAPILNELNRGGGLIMGALNGMIFIYFIMAMVELLYPLELFTGIVDQIQTSSYAVYLYDHNILKILLQTLTKDLDMGWTNVG